MPDFKLEASALVLKDSHLRNVALPQLETIDLSHFKKLTDIEPQRMH